MTARIAANNTRNLPPMLGEPTHVIATRKATKRLLALLKTEHPYIVHALITKNGTGRNDPDAEEQIDG